MSVSASHTPTLIQFVSLSMPRPAARSVRQDRRVRQVMQTLITRLQAIHYVTDLAITVKLGPDQLARLFKRETGYTPLQYLKRLRLARAGQLLLTTELRVKEIAAQVGYQDETRLMRDFKAIYGLTPTEFRLSQ